MAHLIQADTEQLRATAKAIRALSEELRQHHSQIVGQADDLVASLLSGQWERLFIQVMAMLNPRIGTFGERSEELASKLEAFADRMDTANAAYAISGQGYTPDSNLPQLNGDSKLNDLAAALDELYKTGDNDGHVDRPVQIVQIAPGEYLILVTGTDMDSSVGSNDWPSNVRTGFNVPSAYLRQIEALIEKHVPPGSTINLAGHSQGGNVIMSLADRQDFVDKYSINSVTTFGSPPNAPYNPRLGDVYHNFALSNDPVPMLNPAILGGTNAFAPRFENQLIAGEGFDFGDLIAGHGQYRDNPYLSRQNLPFDVSQWTPIGTPDGTFEAGPKDSLRIAYDNIASGDPLRMATGVVDGGVDLIKQREFVRLQNTTSAVTQYLPDYVRTSVDRHMDRLGDTITTGPSPSQSIYTVADGVVTTTTAPIRGIGTIGTSIVEGNTTSITATAEGVQKIASGDIVGGGAQIVQGQIEGTRQIIDGTVDGIQQTGEGLVRGTQKTLTGVRDFFF